ncbi:hypothetical protein [Phaeodactylibacter luteus]|uniref:TonB family protein n=1 Tax=Phaeodactylibacter luteus TaxID=1564516 RepID=A0A5C6RH72_9BACT|nr:hypothetical protein [Phaeodactylibacter luteus]TXB61269.1 hypothetical protein FRY97_19945 [Phaeodactylibacter luteus]
MAVETQVTQQDEQHKKRGMMISVAVHVALLMLALLPLLTFPDPPPGQEGILVNLGLPDMGSGDENAGPTTPAEVQDEELPPEEAAAPPEPSVADPEPEPDREVITAEDSEVALRKQEEERKKRQEAEADRKRRAEEEAKKKAEEEARRKAEEARKKREAEAADLKNSVGGLFGGGDGKGNTGTPGNQGDPNGDPNSDILTGISTGSGTVGGGLGSRGVARTHKPQDNSQDQGIVVVKVCVDRSGSVISAEFTQRGSTASSARLKNLAISSAKKWQFARGDIDRQCGTITYNFRAQ